MKISTGGTGTISLVTLIALYSLSVVTSLPGLAISPILGTLQTVFKEASELELQLLESLPSFVIIPFILLSGRLSLTQNKSRIMTIGLGLFVASSLLYFTAKSIIMLLIYSVTLGIGAGIVIPFSTGLIADYFTKDKRSKQLGIVSAVSNLSLVLATLLAGFLANISWRYAFGVYCISIISFLLSFLLRDKKQQAVSTVEIPSDSTKNIVYPIKIMIFYFFITFIVLAVPFNLSILIGKLGIAHSSDYSAVLISLFFLSITMPGLFINKIKKILGKRYVIVPMIAITISILIFSIAKHSFLFTTGTIILGLAYGILQPIIYDKTALSVPAKHVTFALSLVMSMNYFAIILFPFIMKMVGKISNFSSSAVLPFIVCGIISAILTYIIYRKPVKE